MVETGKICMIITGKINIGQILARSYFERIPTNGVAPSGENMYFSINGQTHTIAAKVTSVVRNPSKT